MKKTIAIALVAASLSAHAFPTYEPFTEFNAKVTASGSNAVCVVSNAVGGWHVITAAVSGTAGLSNSAVSIYDSELSPSLDFSSGGSVDPQGEAWTTINFAGTNSSVNAANVNPTNWIRGLDVAIIDDNAGVLFPNSSVSSLLPSTFPGFPASGTGISTLLENPSQPDVWNGAAFTASPNIVGNSAVLNFSQDITRPATGIKTVYVSYLLRVAQNGQLGTGNNGRFLAFVAQTNLSVGPGSTGSYSSWSNTFNTFGTTPNVPHYVAHALLQNGSGFYLGGVDTSAGKGWSTSPLTGTFGTPVFVVGAYQLSASGNDTNYLWANPAVSAFGGASPPSTSVQAFKIINNLTDIGGLVFIDRIGNGAAGGVGTNYIANLIVGTTWSYVTGGPEFTNQPIASTNLNLGNSFSLTGQAVAAGQAVTYQWQKVSGGVTNNVSNGAGGAGGTGTVSGATTTTLSVNGIGAADTGIYQLVATASGTTYTLTSSQTVVGLSDPQIVSSPVNASGYYGSSITFTTQVSTASAPLTYQWYKGSTPLVNGTQADGSVVSGAGGTTTSGTAFSLILTLSGISYQDIGNYLLYVTNSSRLSVGTAAAALSVADPYITAQPIAPGVAAGGNATFTVAATGSATLSYQWYEGTTALSDGGTTVGGSATVSGSQSATLSLANVSDADNGNYYVVISGSSSGQSVNSATAVLTVQDPLTVISTPISRTERSGDHLAFVVGVTGGGPQFQWQLNGTPLSGATNAALVLANIQPANGGTYSVAVQNLATAPQPYSATLTVVSNTVLPLYSTNLIVARVGDGAQPLSGSKGNTLYLDQYTPAGTYLDTVQIPDEATGAAYGTGSSGSAGTSPALIVQGAGTDAPLAAQLSLSGGNQEFLSFAGYSLSYPFSGSDVTVGATAGAYWRGIGLVNAFGIYSLAYTNSGIDSAGNHTVRAAVTLDGTNFWVSGQASANGVKFVSTAVSNYATGNGVPTLTSSPNGAGAVQIDGGNVLFADFFNGAPGIYGAAGTPEPAPANNAATVQLLNTGNGSYPIDFAISPDTNTVYVADGLYGIQRWDQSGGSYSLSYTIQINPNSLYGASSLAVDFSAASTWGPGVSDAKIYATTYGSVTNSLVYLVDNGAGSTPVIVQTAAANNTFRGIRFGPALIAPSFAAQPQSQGVVNGASTTLSANVAGSGPFTYQWYFQAGGTGAYVAITGATNSNYVVSHAGSGSWGNYYVTATSPVGTVVQSATATVSQATAPYFTTESYLGIGAGFQVWFTGTSGLSYSIYTTTNLGAGSGAWSKLSSGNLSGETDTYTDTNGGVNPQQFYIITSP